MVKRAIPEKRNPLIGPDSSPSHEILVERRRLGQTNLQVRPGVVGVTNASKAENLGTFDYAHLRVPLPKDLSGSGIFLLSKLGTYPESYFLMRRSSDGYISATGMFKAAFPWASAQEEETERKYQKTFPSAGPDEVAGSVWIAPEEALQLSEEYGMRPWIEALLDPELIEKGNKDRHNTQISTPPRFDISALPPAAVLPPSSALRSTRTRASRSVSPSKIATPSRKMASPRKSRRTAKSDKPDPTKAEAAVRVDSATSALQNVLENGTVASESVASESVNGETVKIEVQESVEQNGEVETTTTNVKIEVPADMPSLPIPDDPQEMIKAAREMVEESKKGEPLVNGAGPSTSTKRGKRKAEEITKDENEEAEAGPSERQPSKKAKTAYTPEQQLTKEKMTTRALLGVTVLAAIGGAFQYFS